MSDQRGVTTLRNDASLETIEMHNARRIEALDNKDRTRIACPQCAQRGVEVALFYASDNVMTSIPPKRVVQCPVCAWVGQVLA